MNTQHMLAVSLMMEPSQPCELVPLQGSLVGLRTLPVAGRRLLGGQRVCAGVKAGLFLLSHLFGTCQEESSPVLEDFYLHTSSRCLR